MCRGVGRTVGDGGRGGDVVLRARANLHALTAFRYKRRFIAANGGKGEGKKWHGANGDSVIVGCALRNRGL